MSKSKALGARLACAAAAAAAVAAASADSHKAFVGHLVDLTGATAFVGESYSSGVSDAFNYIIAQGGPVGQLLEFESVDYSYKVPQAIAQYKKWTSRDGGMVAMQGWGTADTEALISFVARDEIPTFSASYSGHLTDPTGLNPNTKQPAPYNFFYGPSYSDGCRAMVQWAKEDWGRTGSADRPKFVHVGANHPYPEAPRKACADYAIELGIEVLPNVVVSMSPGDFKAQCLTIKESGANYAFMANLGPSITSLLQSCAAVGTETKFVANIWAGDRPTLESAGDGAAYNFVAASAFWGDDVPGMGLVREIAGTDRHRRHHYLRGLCTAFYMKEAMEIALAKDGKVTGKGVRDAMYERSDWVPAGLEGVCLPSTWSPTDHRGTMQVNIYSGRNDSGNVTISKIGSTELPRREDWLGY